MNDGTGKSFLSQLEELINRCSLENDSNTPDFILAEYLSMCLNAYNQTVKARDKWYGFKPWPETTTTTPPLDKEKP